ncbi:MAG: hypothetical protein GY875_07585 [Gammaproteobacteria bacterium]|nr:hypothetical protein [Gammaproteobacteria bacterium]
MLDEVQRFRDLGYRVHSCKVGADVAMDIERIDLLGANECAGEIMFYDANRAWLPREAITVLNSIMGVSSWFEQPCETLDEIAQVRRQTRYPICVDEGLHSIEDLIRIQRDGIAELVNIKINRVGGLTRARRMRNFCLATGITMLVMDTDGWHFDTNDVVFSLLLQTPEAGGEFEYAPYIRSASDENYAGISRVVDDPQGSAQRPAMGLGDFNVFMGDLSLHRVTPVIGARKRIVALFCYDREPGMVFGQSYIDELQASMGSY